MAAQEFLVNLVSKEIELTKLLASNDPKTRSEGIKQIKQLLKENSGDTADAFKLQDYLIIWRGLFYFMWMSDKPLPQENAAEKISCLVHCCTSHQGKVLFLEAYFLTIKDDWMSISQHRIDKFSMLVRRCLRQVLFSFVNCDWDLDYMKKFSEILYRALKSFTLSLRSHFQEIFLEELAKVSKGKVPSEALVTILDAFLHFISELNDSVLIKEVVQNVFRNLLSQSPDLEILQAKYQAWKQLGKPGSSYTDLELVEGDISDDDYSNKQNNGPLDPRAGNVSVVIPRIKFNPKAVSHILNKYLTEVDCSRKCLIELTKLLKWYNRLGEGVLPYKPKDLKLNSQVLKRKKKKHLSKMIKEGVKRLEIVDSKIKKSSRQVNDLKSLKELEKMGEIIVKHGKIGKSTWKVRKFEENNALKENISLNESWTVTDEAKKNDGIQVNVCSEDEPPLLAPAGFIVEDFPVNNSSPSLKSLTEDDSFNKRKSPKSVTKSSKKSISPLVKSNKSPNILNVSTNEKSFLDQNKELTNVKRQSGSSTTTPGSTKKLIKKERLCDTFSEHDDIKPVVIQSFNSIENANNVFDNVLESESHDDFVISKIESRLTETIEGWNVCDNTALNLAKQKSPKSKSPLAKNSSPNNSYSSLSVSAQNNDLMSNEIKSESYVAKKRTSLSSTITPEKNSKSPRSPKSPTPEQRVLRRRTIIISKKKPDGQKDATPKKKCKDITSTNAMQKRRKTVAGEEIMMSMLKPDEISNKALEKVRSEAFEDGLNTPRKSSRLSFKTDSAKKRVEFQLRNNIEQEFMEYRTTLKKKKENPHDASKQPVHGVLKSTPDANRINPFYKFKETSVKKKSRKSII